VLHLIDDIAHQLGTALAGWGVQYSYQEVAGQWRPLLTMVAAGHLFLSRIGHKAKRSFPSQPRNEAPNGIDETGIDAVESDFHTAVQAMLSVEVCRQNHRFRLIRHDGFCVIPIITQDVNVSAELCTQPIALSYMFGTSDATDDQPDLHATSRRVGQAAAHKMIVHALDSPCRQIKRPARVGDHTHETL